MRILGIDPGKTGGWAVVDESGLSAFGLMPIFSVPKGRGKTNVLSAEILAQTLMGEFPLDRAYIEKVNSMPKQGVASSFDFGKSFGIAIGVVAAQHIPMEFITPQAWRKTVGIVRSGDLKAGSQAKAVQTWPHHAKTFNVKKNEGIWEASLIALAGWKLAHA